MCGHDEGSRLTDACARVYTYEFIHPHNKQPQAAEKARRAPREILAELTEEEKAVRASIYTWMDAGFDV